jgi:hypothetical protein
VAPTNAAPKNVVEKGRGPVATTPIPTPGPDERRSPVQTTPVPEKATQVPSQPPKSDSK